MEFKKGDKIYFTHNPKLNSKHTYEILEVSGEGLATLYTFQNLESKKKFDYSTQQMVMLGGRLRESTVEVIDPPVQVICNHPETHIVKFSTFSFKQCKICKADLGDA